MFNAVRKLFNRPEVISNTWDFNSQSAKSIADFYGHTPDIASLEQYEFQNVFVFNECMKKNRKHDVIADAEPLAAAFTTDKYVVWKKNLGEKSYPILLETSGVGVGFGEMSSVGYPSQVLGQLYKMRPYEIAKLDTHMQNTVSCQRSWIWVDVPYRRKDGRNISDRMVKQMRVWAHIGRPEYWNPLLDSFTFSAVKLYNEKSLVRSYYYYNEKLENRSE
jgi:hypothetical protein